jgi:predicted 3-demethylubiquinone-9 3-methyltransferase (glyoxalase superfamily)
VKIQTITPSLTFKKGAEEAAQYYVSVFSEVFGSKNGGSKILHTTYFGEEEIKALSFLPEDARPGPAGSVLTVRFQLNGQEFMAVNGGSFFKFTEGMSLYVECDTQEQIDALMERLSADKQAEQCGWLKDKWGVSWQIAPAILRKMAESPDTDKQQRVMVALYGMKRIDIEKLKKAYEGNKNL